MAGEAKQEVEAVACMKNSHLKTIWEPAENEFLPRTQRRNKYFVVEHFIQIL